MSEERRRFEHLLPFYLNGSINHEDKTFFERYLSLHPETDQSIAFTKHLQYTVKTFEHGIEPDTQRVTQIIKRWHATKKKIPDTKLMARTQWIKDFLIGPLGLGLTAVMTSLILILGAIQFGVLHSEELDGRPDLELVLASGITPDHEVILAQLKKLNAVVLSASEQGGYHRILVDLPHPARQQYTLIENLQESGHLKDFTLLATR